MKLTTVSNYINHHRIPLSNEIYKQLGNDYHFIQTQPMEEERVKMGWGKEMSQIPYLKLYYEEPEACDQLIMDSDIVIYSGLEEEAYLQPRLKAGRPVIRGSERLYREGQWKAISPRGLRKKYLDHTRYRKSPVYLLCHGAYVASDFHIVRAYPDKMFQWGYFTEVKQYNLPELFAGKREQNPEQKDCVHLLWAGRFMPLKHPEYAIEAAKELKKRGFSFQLSMIGGGEMEDALFKMTADYDLEQEIRFCGYLQPSAVREYMEKADIFLFTSNHLEGWGAVLNESMNSGCAVVAGSGIGAVPFLIQNGYNGLVYPNEDKKAFLQKVVELMENEKLRIQLGENAYQTMVSLWNPEIAADRLLQFCHQILTGKIIPPECGPLSIAPVISPRKGMAISMKKRIYICHTFYHVYVAMLKECNSNKGIPGEADLALSSISTQFGSLKERLDQTGLFQTVYALDEKREDFFPELAKYRKNYHNVVRHLYNRIIFTKMLPKCEEPYMTIDFKQYEDIYVFCDSDPIGYYLNYKKIPYHACEDGLDCLKNLDDAYVANYGHFGIKALLAKWNLIFIQNGFSKYCLDMEVNNIALVPGKCDKLIERPRKEMEKKLTTEQKKLFLKAFLEDADSLSGQFNSKAEGEEYAMFLTEPHPVDEEARKKVCLDIIKDYCQGYRVLIKPHPRDMIDYEALCPDCVVLRGRFPIEVLNMIEGIHVKKAISIVTTAMDAIDFVDEKINLGASFWDAYEPKELHAYNKKAGFSLANDTIKKH